MISYLKTYSVVVFPCTGHALAHCRMYYCAPKDLEMTYHLTGGLGPHRIVEVEQPLRPSQGNVQ
jgi:hypothetical protein